MAQDDAVANFPQGSKALAARLKHPARAGSVLLADCSASMNTGEWAAGDDPSRYPLVQRDGGTFRLATPAPGSKRIERLAKLLGYLLSRVRLQALIAFNDYPQDIPLTGHISLPEPTGGTALDLALDHVASLRPTPRRVIVLSDGEPNDVERALAAARRLRPIPIDARFVGLEGHASALAFMQRLAEAGGPGGEWGRYDLGDLESVAMELTLRITHQR